MNDYLEAWDRRLRTAGFRITPQRQLVLEAVTNLRHATPEEILTEVQETASGVNLSTVYRTLEVLEQVGLVTHAHIGHGAPTYHVVDGDPHIHLRCSKCERVFSLPAMLASETVDTIRTESGFQVDPYHITFDGQCEKCARNTE